MGWCNALPPPPKKNTAEQKSWRGKSWGKIKQALSTIIIMIFGVKKVLAQATAHPNKSHAHPKVGTKFMTQKIAHHPLP